MAASHKPDHYSSVSPYLVVSGATRTIDFLKTVFNATSLRHYPRPDGTVMHGEVRIDDTVIMIADGTEGWPPISSHVHIYVPDVDATYQRALEAGGVSVQEPRKNDGEDDKRAGVKDAGGTTWWIATQMA